MLAFSRESLNLLVFDVIRGGTCEKIRRVTTAIPAGPHLDTLLVETRVTWTALGQVSTGAQ